MQLYRLPVDAWMRPDPPDLRNLRSFRGPRLPSEILADAARAIDEEDWLAEGVRPRPPRPPRRSLLRRLRGR